MEDSPESKLKLDPSDRIDDSDCIDEMPRSYKCRRIKLGMLDVLLADSLSWTRFGSL